MGCAFEPETDLPGVTQLVVVETFAQPRRIDALPMAITILSSRFNDDAVDRTGRQTQGAAGAFGGNHGVHEFAGPDDRIHRTGVDTQRAADTGGFFDARNCGLRCDAVCGVQRQRFFAEQRCDFRDDLVTTRRALVEGRFAGCDGIGIGPAAGVAALSALRLRQHGVDHLG